MGKKEPHKFSHLDSSGNVRMVDVSSKKITERFAKASAVVHLSNSTLLALRSKLLKKGDAFAAAKIAGILAAKKVSELIPLAHPIPITHCEIFFKVQGENVAAGLPFDNLRTSLSRNKANSNSPATNVITTGKNYIKIIATVKTKAETGVEMEALTAVSVAALTLYDMFKSVERGAVIEKIQLEEKSGGKSGRYKRRDEK